MSDFIKTINSNIYALQMYQRKLPLRKDGKSEKAVVNEAYNGGCSSLG